MTNALHQTPDFIALLKKFQENPSGDQREFMLAMVRHSLRGFRNLYPCVEALMSKPLPYDFWEDLFSHSKDVDFFNTKIPPSLLRCMEQNFLACLSSRLDQQDTFERSMAWFLAQGVSVDAYHALLDEKLKAHTGNDSTLWMIAFMTNYSAKNNPQIRLKTLKLASKFFCLDMNDLQDLTSRYIENSVKQQGLFNAADLAFTDNYDYIFRNSKMMIACLNWHDEQTIDSKTRIHMWTGWIDRFLSHVRFDPQNSDHIEFGMRLLRMYEQFPQTSELRVMAKSWMDQVPDFYDNAHLLIRCSEGVGNISFAQLSQTYILRFEKNNLLPLETYEAL